MDTEAAPSPHLALWRRAVATAAALTATAALVYLLWPVDHVIGWIEIGLIASTPILLHVPRVEAAVLCRAIWWGTLAFSAIAFALLRPCDDLVGHAFAMAGSTSALLATGSAGLRSGTGAFAPIVLSRSLVTMMVVALATAHLLVLSDLLFGASWRILVPLALVVSTIGLARTRSWGLFVYVAAIAGAIGTALAIDPDPPYTELPTATVRMAVQYGAAIVLFAVGLPVLTALVFRRRPPEGETSARPWGEVAHGVLVMSVVALSIMGQLAL